MPALVVPSPTVAFISWAQSNAAIAAVLGTRVSSSLPVRGVTYPWARVRRITGIPQVEMPMDMARLQVEVWGGTTANGLPNWDVADEPARVMLAEVREFRGATVGDAYIAELSPFEGVQQLEDPETKDARFWFDVRCVVRRSDGG